MDVIVENHGSLVLIRPMHSEAMTWLETHTPEDAQWFGGALVVEPRYVNDIINGMWVDGLAVY